jgi:hypothetical protein
MYGATVCFTLGNCVVNIAVHQHLGRADGRKTQNRNFLKKRM